jgi:hypothetical protein
MARASGFTAVDRMAHHGGVLYERPARRPVAGRSRRSTRRTRKPLVLGAAIVVVVAALAATVILERGSSSPGAPLLPSSFEVVYRVTTSSTLPSRVTWEVLDVSGPFDVSDLTYGSDPRDGAAATSGTVSTFGDLYDLTGGKLQLVSARPPALGSGDQALLPEVPDLRARGLASQPGGTREISGQSCTTLRVSEPPAGPLTPLAGADHDDLCLSGSGLELAEAWTYHGRVVLQRTAIEITVRRHDSRIAALPTPSPGAAATGLVRVGPPTGPSFLAAPPPPGGFTAMGPVATVTYDPTQSNQVIDTSTVWAFRRGGDVVTVEAGQGQLPWDDAGVPVRGLHLAGLGAAESVLQSEGPEIQVQLAESRWVRVDGAVPLSYLSGYAGRLRLG